MWVLTALVVLTGCADRDVARADESGSPLVAVPVLAMDLSPSGDELHVANTRASVDPSRLMGFAMNLDGTARLPGTEALVVPQPNVAQRRTGDRRLRRLRAARSASSQRAQPLGRLDLSKTHWPSEVSLNRHSPIDRAVGGDNRVGRPVMGVIVADEFPSHRPLLGLHSAVLGVAGRLIRALGFRIALCWRVQLTPEGLGVSELSGYSLVLAQRRVAPGNKKNGNGQTQSTDPSERTGTQSTCSRLWLLGWGASGNGKRSFRGGSPFGPEVSSLSVATLRPLLGSLWAGVQIGGARWFGDVDFAQEL